jgi:YVTN family beta-propeller protein
MKRLIILALMPCFLFSCIKDPNPVLPHSTTSYLDGPGVYIVNEGNFRSGNGSLSFFSYDSSKIFNNVFLNANQRSLGDVPYYMTFMGTQGYIVVNNSGKIEVVRPENIKTVSTVNGLVSPRYIALCGDNKAYVSSLYSDSVTVLDISSNSIRGYIDVKHSSESVIVIYSTAYVGRWTAGNKIIVINTANDQVTDSIEVGMEPESMVLDRNEILWVLCNGGWQREYYAELIGISTATNTIVKRFTFPSKDDSPTCLQIDGTGETLYYIQNGIRKMSINAPALPMQNFIEAGDRNLYKIGINPGNGDIFVTDVADYQQKGYVLRYSKDGTLIGTMQAGIIPGSICFKTGQDGTTQ